MPNDFSLEMIRQFADSAWRFSATRLLPRSDRVVIKKLVAASLAQLIRNLLELFQRKQEQLMRVDAFLP